MYGCVTGRAPRPPAPAAEAAADAFDPSAPATLDVPGGDAPVLEAEHVLEGLTQEVPALGLALGGGRAWC